MCVPERPGGDGQSSFFRLAFLLVALLVPQDGAPKNRIVQR